jgi:arylsulfatase A-like enzyme
MTGVHPYRGGLHNTENFRASVTLPQMLRNRGYSTALLGKWHLGMEEGLHPLDRGFDRFYGTAGSNDPVTVSGQKQVYETFRTAREEKDWPVSLFEGRECVEHPARQSLFTQRYTGEACRIIREGKAAGRPFFIYLAHNMPHVPLFASDAFRGRSRGGLYGDVVEEIDWSVGEIVKTLEEEGLRENTLVIFTSDNGPWTMLKEFGGTAAPLRGEKGTGWEGGPRVPAVFSWPGRIQPDVSDAFMVNVDLYATLAAIAEGELPKGHALDSLDMSGVLLKGEASPRASYLFFSGARFKEPFSYRSGNRKIHLRTNDRSRNPDTGAVEPVSEHAPPLLFDLATDISETTDIAGDEPDVLARLAREFHAKAKELES